VTGIVSNSGTVPRAAVQNQQEALSLTLATYTPLLCRLTEYVKTLALITKRDQ